jgi:bis(5'-nucleosyl)-tetraphosphatase (symmetrical)
VSIYAIGDVQGCYDDLRALLDGLAFDPANDRLWFVGDLVNRGPRSLDVLRYVRDLGDAAVTVLGNHDLHLLAIAAGNRRKHDGDAGLEAVLAAPDRDQLLHWLRHRPLLHRDTSLGFTMVHAGLPPQWDIATATACAREVEQALQGDDHLAYFLDMYGNKPKLWDPQLRGMERLRFITNCLTRLRYCAPDGTLRLKDKGPPGTQRTGFIPWYQHPGRASRGERIVFGHWSTLGYVAEHNVWALDTGCLWGGALTALRLDGPRPIPSHLPCRGQANPLAFA